MEMNVDPESFIHKSTIMTMSGTARPGAIKVPGIIDPYAENDCGYTITGASTEPSDDLNDTEEENTDDRLEEGETVPSTTILEQTDSNVAIASHDSIVLPVALTAETVEQTTPHYGCARF